MAAGVTHQSRFTMPRATAQSAAPSRVAGTSPRAASRSNSSPSSGSNVCTVSPTLVASSSLMPFRSERQADRPSSVHAKEPKSPRRVGAAASAMEHCVSSPPPPRCNRSRAPLVDCEPVRAAVSSLCVQCTRHHRVEVRMPARKVARAIDRSRLARRDRANA